MRPKVIAAYVAVWIAYIGAIVWSSFALPENPATHFGVGGVADGYMSRGAILVTDLGIAVLILCGLPLFAWGLSRGSGAGVNVPNKDYWFATPQRIKQFRVRFTDDMLVLAAMTGVLFVFATIDTVRANRLHPPTSGNGFWVVMALYLAGVAWWVVCIYRRYRIPDEGTPSAVREH